MKWNPNKPYANIRWRKESKAYLQAHPLCVYCGRHERVSVATIVDHIEPHKGDYNLFWNQSNWQGLCKRCHDSDKQRLEKSGKVQGCDINGIPLDPNNHWNKSK